MAALIERRGIREEAMSPLAFPDAAKAAERIARSLRTGETVGIFGDYDCDGVTSTALLVRFLRRHGADPIVRLPRRIGDGYGLKPGHVDELAAQGVKLLLTVDTGITAYAAVERAAALGIDVIIFDHHALLRKAPPAFAILHPALADHPDPHPSAAGVVFAFLHALEGEAWEGRDEDCALAMLGTVADLVGLRGSNRALVREGLAALHRLQNCPLAELAARVRTGTIPLSSIDVAFRIAPRINAAGRMADPILALRAVLEGGDALDALEFLNSRRQGETQTCVDHALSRLRFAEGTHLPAEAFLCAADASYAPGIIGLIAGKLAEKFGRPSMAVSVQGDECTASLRSPGCYDIAAGLSRCADLLDTFGGHRQAAGCTFALASLEKLCERLNQDVTARISPDDLVPSLNIDVSLPLAALTLPIIYQLRQLEPFGQENAEPLFLIPAVELISPRTVGREGQHLQAMIAGGHKLIAFGLGRFANELHGRTFDLVCRLSVDTWNGREQVQLSVVDLRHAYTGASLPSISNTSVIGTPNAAAIL